MNRIEYDGGDFYKDMASISLLLQSTYDAFFANPSASAFQNLKDMMRSYQDKKKNIGSYFNE